MATIVNEAFKISRSNDLRNNPIAFVDPSLPENVKTYEHKDILKNYGAKWSKSPQFRNIFPPHSTGFWFWFIGKTEDNWRSVYNKMIKPALEKVHSAEDVAPEESKESLIASLDAIIEKISTADPVFDTNALLTTEDKETIKDKLEDFKLTITNIKDDKEFKETIKKIMVFKQAQGHEFSFMNTILILTQRLNAKVVKSKSNWFNLYNRKLNDGAKPIWIRKPAESAKRQYSRGEKDNITSDFLKNVGKRDVGDLGSGEKERLNVALSGQVIRRQFELYDVYDVDDTTLIEGKPDPVQDILQKHKISWFTGDEINDDVKPIYDALIGFADDKNINVDLVSPDELGGARGLSRGGGIKILNSEGNDVGITKTLAHELAHELLHWRYAKGKDKELEKFFIGSTEGRELVEQQAELTAWMTLAAFGFDLKTTSFNYAAIWGADDKSMITVFDNVSGVANYLISEITKRGGQLSEVNVDMPMNKKQYTPADVADILNVEDKFQDAIRQNKQNIMLEKYNKLLNK